MLVKMRHYISGGRWDGRDWPDPAVSEGTIEVPDWEGHDLIRGGMAVFVAPGAVPGDGGTAQLPGHLPEAPEVPEAPEITDVPGPEPAAAADAAAAITGNGPDTAPGEPAEPAAEPIVAAAGQPAAAPGPSAPKTAWIEYAVSRGAAPDTAAAMTKADLMSRYGGRL